GLVVSLREVTKRQNRNRVESRCRFSNGRGFWRSVEKTNRRDNAEEGCQRTDRSSDEPCDRESARRMRRNLDGSRIDCWYLKGWRSSVRGVRIDLLKVTNFVSSDGHRRCVD